MRIGGSEPCGRGPGGSRTGCRGGLRACRCKHHFGNVSVPVNAFAIVGDDAGALPAGSLVDCNTVHAGIAGMSARDAPGVFPVIAPYEKVTDGEAHLSDHKAWKQH